MQKLAKERGFKSVTAYLKQKIVELALGVDSPDTNSSAAGGGDAYANLSGENQILLVELTRIHNELRAFADNADANSFAASANSAASPFDLPPPGQFASGLAQAAADLGSAQPNYSGSPNSAGAALQGTAAEAVSSQVLPSSNLGGFGFRLGGFSTGSPAVRFQPPVENNDRLSGYREIMDDLEELADRAFAISPRLGALDESAPAEAATGRGARPSSESIFVEPILPQPVKVEPINMVKPVSASELPGPAEIASVKAAPQPAPQAAAPAPKVEPPPAPAPELEPGPEPEPEPAAEAASNSPAPAPAPVQEQFAPPEPAPSSVSPPAPAPPPPMPGDDLLSDLLDEALVAHAVAPRPADNPFAVNLGFEKYDTADGAATEGEVALAAETDDHYLPSDSPATIASAAASAPTSAQIGSPPFADPDQADEVNSGRPATADMGQEPYSESDQNADQELMSSDEAGAQKVAQSEAQAVRPYHDVASSGSADPTTPAGGPPQYPADPNSGGQSNQSTGMSGGPPPRRRRT